MWSPHVQHLVQRWHTECTANHEYCKIKDIGHIDEDKHLHVDFQPTRILDISDGKMRLDTEPHNRIGQQYASLTHRWSLDPSTMPRLNDKNIHQWCEEIDPSILTPIFSDAVQVARLLNMRYVWIDSLCIQQTGPGWEEDWQHEAAVMGEVYRHAFLNIQAGRDADIVTYGLFTTPHAREIDPFQVDISRSLLKPKLRTHSTYPSININGTYSLIEEDFARDELLGNAINRRGWVRAFPRHESDSTEVEHQLSSCFFWHNTFFLLKP
jgi:Heterokaryon incompatibility protein (HET)